MVMNILPQELSILRALQNLQIIPIGFISSKDETSQTRPLVFGRDWLMPRQWLFGLSMHLETNTDMESVME